MTKPASTAKKPRKQHTPEFRQEALKLAERIGVAAAAREPTCMNHSSTAKQTAKSAFFF
jgi:transposase